MKNSQKHILVAEDDTFLISLMRKVLSKHNIRVSSARNGQEAIDIIEKDPPHLLLLDLLMPHVDGYAVLEYRKAKGLKFPVVICSNISDKTNKERCKALGAKAYLIKSDIDDEELWPRVEEYLR